LLFVFCSFAAIAQNAPVVQDPRIGTWKLNLEKSKFAQVAPKMSVRRYVAQQDGFIVDTTVGIDSQGNPVFAQTTFKLDGSDYPQYTQNSLAAFSSTNAKPSTNAYKVVDSDTVEATTRDTMKKPTAITVYVVSKDRKTMTLTSKSPAGELTNVTVWEKQ
jgi:hypothetical protein